MTSIINNITDSIVSFLEDNQSELPAQDFLFYSFVRQCMTYLANQNHTGIDTLQKQFIRATLIPLEKAGKGRFKFSLDHAPQSATQAPTIQITSTAGNMHAIIIKRSDTPITGYNSVSTIDSDVGTFQIAHATNRLTTDIDLEQNYPRLHAFKKECAKNNTPIIYTLGAARQFPTIHAKHKRAVAWQRTALQQFFHLADEYYDGRVVYGTGGWAGKIEGSMGVPRLSYLSATKKERTTLITMPHCGAYDRHEEVTLEVFCGQEWGDDSSVLAAVCDGAVVLSPFGAWTQIEMHNLLMAKKPLVVVESPANQNLAPDEIARTISTNRGSYSIFRDTTDAARSLFNDIAHANAMPAQPVKTLPNAQDKGTLYQIQM